MRFLPAMLQFHRSSERARVPHEQDPADLGTAFGMEACLGDEVEAPPMFADTVAAEALRQEAPMSWLSRRAGAR